MHLEKFTAVQLIVIALLFVLFIKQGYAFEMPKEKGPTDYPQDTFATFIKSGSEGVISSFLGSADLRSNKNQVSFYESAPGDINASYLISNYTNTELEYVLFCLIDYELTPCFADNDRKIRNESIKSKERHVINIKISRPSIGAHDFSIIAFDKNNASMGNVHLYHRAVFYIGSNVFREEKTAFIEAIEDKRGGDQAVINGDKSGLNFKHAIEMNIKGQGFFHIRNGEDSESNYKLLAFTTKDGFDDLRIIQSWNSFRLKPNQSAALPIEIARASLNEKLFAILIENPYCKLESDGMLLQRPSRIIVTSVTKLAN